MVLRWITRLLRLLSDLQLLGAVVQEVSHYLPGDLEGRQRHRGLCPKDVLGGALKQTAHGVRLAAARLPEPTARYNIIYIYYMSI